ncbi:hypothetical protein EPUS_07397 [Endocarpon pusillum Z07020]|uniref:BZIP domain-containing protein n=1 Tax=Endocarpon pusillum (strain Z07020 / HMAS-L-300199) TaxID=1263415 RepID=U1GEZ5_ENDPU|nr:uncharacterized protein EPUS_07397 [Endocarpon pusillum Z07020]ERF76197.1 hypothetical protein EPUS_07397 [Endocarpon pusillum Z07020]
MDYTYYPTPQAPYQFLGFTSEPNRTHEDPKLNGFTGSASSANQHFDPGFPAFDHSVYDTNNFVPPHFTSHQHPVHESPAPSISPSGSLQHNGHISSTSEPNISSNNGVVEQNVLPDPMGDVVGEDFMNRTRSSSEEKDSMTPAQNKRKAQNRAAQRAFRERKERHVKELEAKLNDLEAASNKIHTENERLKRELAKVATENEILRATSSTGPLHHRAAYGSQSARQDEEIMNTGPMKYTPTDFLATLGVRHSGDNESAYTLLDPPTTKNNGNDSSSPSLDPNNPVSVHHSLPAPLISSQGSFTLSAHKITISPLTGNRLLSSGATWDYIQAHPLFKQGLVDIADVSEKLKGKSECDGTGPAFEEESVDRAIRESAALGKDELI